MKITILLWVTLFCYLQFSYSQAGQLDPSFGNNGVVKTGIYYNSTVIQADAKIVLAGSRLNGEEADFLIARYNTDGTLDKTFNSIGTQTTDFGAKDSPASLAIQKDGKILMAGTTTTTTANPDDYDSSVFCIARYNTDGSIDNTFGSKGKVQTDFYNNGKNYGPSLAIQSNGKIVLTGTSSAGERNAVIVRYNTDGSLDKTFNEDGKQTLLFNQNEGRNNYYVASANGATGVAIQADGKIIVSASIPSDFSATDLGVLARVNSDGSIDTSYGINGTATFFDDATYIKIVQQEDGKIDMSGFSYYRGYSRDYTARFNNDGSFDIYKQVEVDEGWFEDHRFANFIAGQPNGKIISGGVALHVYDADGSFDSTFKGNGQKFIENEEWAQFYHLAISGNKLYAVGSNSIVRYFLDNESTISPEVSLTAPTNNATYIAPAAHIKLSAEAIDKDGTISKVQFYNGTTLLHTETLAPYGFVWRNVPRGNYTLSAKAYDNSGNVTTSKSVKISVVPNKPPTVSIITPKSNQAFAVPGYIHFEANAKDIDGRITRVDFYNGSTLLNTQYQHPYRFVWKNVPRGRYTITAVATDNWGARTTSAPVTVKVVLTPATIVSNKPSLIDDKTYISNALSLTLAPNPASGIVNIYTTGLQQDKQVSISVLSVSGIVMKTMLSSSSENIRLDVSSLKAGVYTILLRSRDKILYKQFVKL